MTTTTGDPPPSQPFYYQPIPQVGWKCPVCNGGVSPTVERCPCVSAAKPDYGLCRDGTTHIWISSTTGIGRTTTKCDRCGAFLVTG